VTTMRSMRNWAHGLTVLTLMLVLTVGATGVARATDWGAVLGGLAVGALVCKALEDDHHPSRAYYYERPRPVYVTPYPYGYGTSYYSAPRPPRVYYRDRDDYRGWVPPGQREKRFRGRGQFRGPDRAWGW